MYSPTIAHELTRSSLSFKLQVLQASNCANINMSTEDVQGTPIHPSYEEVAQSNGIRFVPNQSRAFQRLVIRLEGPLSTAVSVMNEEEDPDGPWEPYYQETADGSPAWHPISQESICDPPISSIKTTISCLEQWEQAWLLLFDDDDLLVPPGDGVDTIWGPPREGCEPDDDETGLSLLYHEGEHRPPNYDKPLEVTAPKDKPYLTIHDFLSVIRPYLVDRRPDILGSLIISTECAPPLPEDTKLIVNGHIKWLGVEPEEAWMISKRATKRMRDGESAAI
jgi:hypothetical protein